MPFEESLTKPFTKRQLMWFIAAAVSGFAWKYGARELFDIVGAVVVAIAAIYVLRDSYQFMRDAINRSASRRANNPSPSMKR